MQSAEEKDVQVKGAVLFIDIVKSSTKWSQFPQEMLLHLRTFDNYVRTFLEKNDGMIIKEIGDAYMIFFSDSSDELEESKESKESETFKSSETGHRIGYERALSFAYALQVQLRNQNIVFSDGKTILECRIGIAYGNMFEMKKQIQHCNLIDLFGGVVNTASRMESKVCQKGGDIAIGFPEDEQAVFDHLIYDIKDPKMKLFFFVNEDLIEKCPYRSGRALTCKDRAYLHGVGNTFVIYLPS